MNLTLNCSVTNVANRFLYAHAPSFSAITSGRIPDNQAEAEMKNLTQKIVIWSMRRNRNARGGWEENYIQVADFVDMVGAIVAMNVQARSEDNSLIAEWGHLPKYSLENERIFTPGFIDSLDEADPVDIDDAQADDLELRNYLVFHLGVERFIQNVNWLPFLRTLGDLDIDGQLERTNLLSSTLNAANYYVSFPECLTGLSNVFQPWIIQYMSSFFMELFPLPFLIPPAPEPGIEDPKEFFNGIYDLLCLYNGSASGRKLEIRHLLKPFASLKQLKQDWLLDFFNVLLCEDIAVVTSRYSTYLTRFREIDIDPAFVADMIVFLFGHVTNSTHEQVTSSICEGNRKRKVIKPNTIDNQLVNNKMPVFYVSKIRSSTLDPIFQVVQKQLTQSCTTTLNGKDRFRLLNLLYRPEEKAHIVEIVMSRRQASIQDNNRPFSDLFESSRPLCKQDVSRITLKESRQISRMNFNKRIKYSSSLTFSPDNCAEKSLNFMKNLDAYSTLFAELVNREFYNVNNVVCTVRPSFTSI